MSRHAFLHGRLAVMPIQSGINIIGIINCLDQRRVSRW